MENFFLQHNVLKDRDADELGGRVNSDSEARCAGVFYIAIFVDSNGLDSDSDPEEEISERVHSVCDPTGPWAQKPVAGGDWGRSQSRFGVPKRHFESSHTGPKGVIKDYKAHKRQLKQEVGQTKTTDAD